MVFFVVCVCVSFISYSPLIPPYINLKAKKYNENKTKENKNLNFKYLPFKFKGTKKEKCQDIFFLLEKLK